MEKGRLYKREFGKIVQDGFWPNNDEDVLPTDNQRYSGMADALCRIPEDDYEALKTKFNYKWFVPGEKENGKTFFYKAKSESPILAPLVKIIYLSPLIEKINNEYSSIAIVAHELAHIAKGHELESKQEYRRKQEEVEAWELVIKWRFEEEVRKYLTYRLEHATTPKEKEWYKEMIDILIERR